MFPPDRFLPGPAHGLRRRLNELLVALKSRARLRAEGDLELSDERVLRLTLFRGIYGKLSGASSPYSWQEVNDDASGTWTVLTTGLSGTANAYEVNATAGLANKYEWLVPDANGDWRFQHVRRGSPSCAGDVCITVHGCGGANLPGATVTLKKGATTVGTCITDSIGRCCIPITVADTYTYTVAAAGYTTSSPASFFVPCTGNTATVNLVATHIPWKFTITGCGCEIQGAVVTLTGPGGFSDTCTTDAAGQCTILAPRTTGSWTWTASDTHYVTASTTSTISSFAGLCILNRGTSLTSDRNYWCFGGTTHACRTAVPGTLTVTLNNCLFWNPQDRGQAFTLTWSGIGTAPQTWTGLGNPDPISGVRTVIDAQISDGFCPPAGPPVTGALFFMTYHNGSPPFNCTPGFTAHVTISGSAACPVALDYEQDPAFTFPNIPIGFTVTE